MRRESLRRWSFVHEWSSLICTPFLLLLCLTGLPLIFHHEIHHLTMDLVEPATPAPEQPANLDMLVANSLAQFPGKVVQYVTWDEEEPNVLFLTLNSSADAPFPESLAVRMDAGTGAYLDQPDIQSGVMAFILQLHTDLFAGLPGKLFLGAMGLLFCAAVISGIVVYGPSMRKLSFGDLRLNRIRLIRWLDLHNLMGILLVAWTLVVAFTGTVNTLADIVLQVWRVDQLAQMVGEHQGRDRPETLSPLQTAVAAAEQNSPGMEPSVVAFPGTPYTSQSHYMVFMKGKTPLTARLAKPVLIDATDSSFTDARDAPWYVSSLLLSQPLHFGDYGGLSLKLLWSVLDIATIVVLISGLYLWIGRRFRKVTRLSVADRRDAEPVTAQRTS